MPTIKPSAYLSNDYDEVSALCNAKAEPIFITKNGHGDLAVMSIATYEKLCDRYELYHLVDDTVDTDDTEDHIDYSSFFTEF